MSHVFSHLRRLTRAYDPCILDHMATTTPTNTAPVPHYLRPAERRTELASFRIYQDQKLKLGTEYDGNASLLVKLLLDAFLKGNLPDVRSEFERLKKT